MRIVCTDPYDTLTNAAMSLMVLQRSSCTSRGIVSTFLGAELVDVCPDLPLSSSDVLPLEARVPLKTPRMTHGLISICTSCHFKSLRSRFGEFHAELMFALCSSFTSMLKLQMWSHMWWHSFCATPNVHTAKPLGILSGDVHCSQAQPTHSHTAISWRSMELVSKLFYTPMYVQSV